MKNSNEWMKDIKEKAEIRFAAQKRKRKIIACISSSVACLALILCSAFMLPNMLNGGLSIGADSSGTTPTLNNSTTSQHTNNSDSQVITPLSSDKQPDQSSSIPGISSETQNPSNPISTLRTDPSKPNVIPVDFTVNKIIGQISAARPYRDPAEHYKETWTAQQMIKYLGVNLTQLSSYMPKDLVYAESDNFTVTFHNSGNIVEDYASFVYKGTDGRSFTVLTGKVGFPYDCVYSLETNNTEKINGTEVLIGGMLKSESSDEYGFFYADFKNHGISFRVQANNLTGEEFYNAVTGIIGLK